MTSYTTTSVPVSRSQEAIRSLLQKFGARGVQFSEDFETHTIAIRFAKLVNGTARTVSVAMKVPEPPQPKRARKRSYRYVRGRMVYDKMPQEKQEQMQRATYRALHYWLKSQFESVEFGLLTFEQIFLAHFEWMVDGQPTTVGQYLIPRLNSDNLLPAPKSQQWEIVEG